MNSAINNSEMKSNRFGAWAENRKMVNRIVCHLTAGGAVQICTSLKATVYTAKNADMFKATKGGAFVQRGKSWDCINYCGIRFSK